jgi:hypothetical protein
MAARMNQDILACLEEAKAKLDRFSDIDDSECAISPDVRRVARIYLDSWVSGPLDVAVRMIKNEPEPGDAAYARSVRTGN